MDSADIPDSASEVARVRSALDAVRGGNHDAYAQVVALYQRRLFNLALMIIRDRAGAEDVVQEAFVRAYAHLDGYDETRAFYPWIATIAARLALNWRRNRAQLPLAQSESAENEAVSATDLLDAVIADERGRRLWQSVAALPQGERMAVLLYYRQDMSVAEAAQVLGVTTGTVKTLLFRAREKLRAAMPKRDAACSVREESNE